MCLTEASVHVDGQPVSSQRLAFVMQPERIVTPQMPADFDRSRDDTMAQQPAQTRNLSQQNDWNLPQPSMAARRLSCGIRRQSRPSRHKAPS